MRLIMRNEIIMFAVILCFLVALLTLVGCEEVRGEEEVLRPYGDVVFEIMDDEPPIVALLLVDGDCLRIEIDKEWRELGDIYEEDGKIIIELLEVEDEESP